MTIDTSKISKTTINGVVSCAIGVVIALSSLPSGAKWTVVALSALRAISGYMQKDAQ
jgi:hypothetical protein